MIETIDQIDIETLDLEELNKEYELLSPEERLDRLYVDFPKDLIMATSSFAATSALLLKLISQACPDQTINFIDTGYHFPETHQYLGELKSLLNLNVEATAAESWRNEFTTKDKTWEKDPNFCCSVNKVEPLERIKSQNKIWISGLMSWQSDHRSTLNIFEKRGAVLKFYPLLDMTKAERDTFIADQKLPFHPLVSQGYASIGCTHCTVPGDDRDGRWNNHPKTECGLHL